MSDSYAEVIVHDEKDIRGTQLKIGLIVLTIVLLFLGAMFSMLIFTLGVLMIPYTIVSIKNRYHEYEYLLVSEELYEEKKDQIIFHGRAAVYGSGPFTQAGQLSQ